MQVKDNTTNTVKSLANSTLNMVSASGVKSSIFSAVSGGESPIIYKNAHAYKSVLVYRAQRMAVQAASQLVTDAVEAGISKLKSAVKKKLKLSDSNTTSGTQSSTYNVIENMTIVSEVEGYELKAMYADVGSSKVSHYFYTRAINGRTVYEALILSYESDEKYAFYDSIDEGTYDTTTVLFYDLAPQISMQSTKNVILTKVQGRDYTRKELVAGGDLSFTVNGVMVDKWRNYYPSEQVKYFLQVMQYGGVLDVQNILFNNYGVKKVLITGYSLPQPSCKNMQPYSFNCVAVESKQEETEDTLNSALPEITIDFDTSSVLVAQSKSETATVSDTTTNI